MVPVNNFWYYSSNTVFENHRKCLIQHCERSELCSHLLRTKVESKCQKWPILASFWKPEACGITVLPDRLILIRQNLVKNARKVLSICKRSSLRSLCWMRHFGWFSNTVGKSLFLSLTFFFESTFCLMFGHSFLGSSIVTSAWSCKLASH